MTDRPSVPHSMVRPTRPRTAPQEPAPQSLPAAESDVIELVNEVVAKKFEGLEKRLEGQINRAMDRVVGAQQTVREETLEQRVKKWRGAAITVGVAAALVAIAVGAAVTTLREYWGTAERAAKAEARPLEERVEANEHRLAEVEGDLEAIERAIGGLGRKLDRLLVEAEPDEDDGDRRRHR